MVMKMVFIVMKFLLDNSRLPFFYLKAYFTISSIKVGSFTYWLQHYLQMMMVMRREHKLKEGENLLRRIKVMKDLLNLHINYIIRFLNYSYIREIRCLDVNRCFPNKFKYVILSFFK